MRIMPVREAYRLWAPSYGENALTFLSEEMTAALSPSPSGKRFLDAGCGPGPRRSLDAVLAIGVDLSPDMLLAKRDLSIAAADIRQLPFADAQFDLIWCRLVLGYLADLPAAYCELARVCAGGGLFLVTDFHSDAAAAGHKRNFRDSSGSWHQIENYVHDTAAHSAAAESSGFVLKTRQDGVVGPSIRHFYEAANRHAAYHRDLGLALVAGFLFQRL